MPETPLLIVAASIKRPYIWNLTAFASVVRHYLRSSPEVFFLEWMAPSDGEKDAGLAHYATRLIGEAVAMVARVGGDAVFGGPFARRGVGNDFRRLRPAEHPRTSSRRTPTRSTQSAASMNDDSIL